VKTVIVGMIEGNRLVTTSKMMARWNWCSCTLHGAVPTWAVQLALDCSRRLPWHWKVIQIQYHDRSLLPV